MRPRFQKTRSLLLVLLLEKTSLATKVDDEVVAHHVAACGTCGAVVFADASDTVVVADTLTVVVRAWCLVARTGRATHQYNEAFLHRDMTVPSAEVFVALGIDCDEQEDLEQPACQLLFWCTLVGVACWCC